MSLSRCLSVLALMAIVGQATAQVVPPPATSTIINFDELTGLPTELSLDPGLSVFPPDTYVNRGITISGFGNSGGVGFDVGPAFSASNPPPAGISLPNILFFASIAPTIQGGLVQSPETLTFYPAAVSVQFDVTLLGSFGLNCEGTEVLQADAFAPGGALVGTQTFVPPDEDDQGITVAFTSAAPGIERLVVRSLSPCLGLLEAFSMDNIAFATLPAPASKCAQQQQKAAGDAAKDQLKCYSKAAQTGQPVDADCLAKAQTKFAKNFAKGTGDCLTDADASTVGSSVDSFAASITQTITGGAPGPDVCDSLKIKNAGTKAADLAKCHSNAAKSGVVADPTCGQKATDKFTKSLKKCGTMDQLAAVEADIDNFASGVARDVTVPTTTTTTTTTSTTTTTTAPPLGPHLSFTTTAGSADCRISPLSDPPTPLPPLSGALFSDTALTTQLAALGQGCLYIGGGNAGVAPSQIPENATTIFNTDGTNLTASFGTGKSDCSRGPEATKHCVQFPAQACTTDADCGSIPGSCQGDANCFFGPPVPINGFPASCVVNTFAADGSGTIDPSTGASSVNITLASRVYLTLAQPTACPQCVDGACTYGENTGGPCTTTNSALTTLDCLPPNGIFIATLPISFNPLSTDTQVSSAEDGNFCSPQQTPGAFGQPDAKAIVQNGQPAGDVTDGLPHASVLVSNFCIPATQNGALDNLGNLPGPGTLSLPGVATLVASPSGAFLMP